MMFGRRNARLAEAVYACATLAGVRKCECRGWRRWCWCSCCCFCCVLLFQQ
jgi:hypothetical protein